MPPQPEQNAVWSTTEPYAPRHNRFRENSTNPATSQNEAANRGCHTQLFRDGFTIRVGTVHLGNHILRTMNVKRRYFHPRIKAFHKQRAVILIIDFFRAAVHFNIPVEVEHLLIIKLIIIKNRQALVPPVLACSYSKLRLRLKPSRTVRVISLICAKE